MRIAVETQGLAETIVSFNGARPKIRDAWKKTAFTIGAQGIEYLVLTFRSGPTTTDRRTAVRTGLLRRSYRQEVKESATGVDLAMGILRPERNVLAYAPVHEFGSSGAGRGHRTAIRARPALQPTIDRILPTLQEQVAADVHRVVGG